ncbi:MAG: hypothetical protein RIS36_1051 [Pseudomonadota bacterium]|jgi:hypothetical protein
MPYPYIPGTVWILSENASCIPSGCYQLQDVQDEILIFSVGREISFGLPRDYYESILKRSEAARPTRTSPRSFLRRYAKLIQAPPRSPIPPSGMTFCAMAPRLQRKLLELCPQEILSRSAPIN